MGKKGDYLIVGRVTKPSGTRGEVKVLPITDDPGRFRKLSAVYVQDGDIYRKIPVERSSVNGDRVVVKLKGCDSVEDARNFREMLLYVTRKRAAKIAKGSYYHYDIQGCRVETLEGEVIGEVYDIQNAGSCDVYCVRSRQSNGREYLIPAVKDVVKQIDIGKKRIVIEALEGLL